MVESVYSVKSILTHVFSEFVLGYYSFSVGDMSVDNKALTVTPPSDVNIEVGVCARVYRFFFNNNAVHRVSVRVYVCERCLCL